MTCSFCGAETVQGIKYCRNCGAEISHETRHSETITAPSDFMEEDRGQSIYVGSVSTEPAFSTCKSNTENGFLSGNDPADLHKVRGWNWGAFMFSWIWALAHQMYIPALTGFIAGFFGLGIFVSIYFGIAGNELAWKSRPFKSVQEFKEVQGKWSRVALIILFCIITLMFIAMVIGAFTGIRTD